MGFARFTANSVFQVPCGVTRVRVLVVGGGSGGGSGNAAGGASGFVNVGEFRIEPGIAVPITIGAGGTGSSLKKNDPTQDAKPGGRSAFGSFLWADGGNAGCQCGFSGGAGGSGGGEGCIGPCWSGIGGKSGSNGFKASVPTNSCYSSGDGQGNYTSILRLFTKNLPIPGSGGSGVFLDNPGGGGGGGIILLGNEPVGTAGSHGGALGGNGFGSGGGSGFLYKFEDVNELIYYPGGNGAPGVVYVEWWWKGETKTNDILPIYYLSNNFNGKNNLYQASSASKNESKFVRKTIILILLYFCIL